MIHQIILLIQYYSFEYNFILIFNLSKTYKHFFIQYMTSFSISSRAYYLSQSIKYSYYHLTPKVYDESFQKKSEENFLENYKNTLIREESMIKIFLYRIMVGLIIFVILMLIKESRCFLFLYSAYDKNVPQECLIDFDGDILIIWAEIFNLIFMFFVYLILLSLLFNIFKYPLKSDIFKIRFEILVNFIICIFFHNVALFQKIEFFEINVLTCSIIRFFEYFCFNLLYVYLIFSRQKIEKKCFLNILENYDIFMHNHLCFSLFKEYIKNYYVEMTNYLAFWVDFYLFKQQLVNGNKDINIFMCRNIYYEYFFQKNYRKESVNYNSLYSDNLFKIEFPVDIHEKVEEVENGNFNLCKTELDIVYNEAFHFVNDKLHRIYLSLCQNELEYKKLERNILFLDIDEVKDFVLKE